MKIINDFELINLFIKRNKIDIILDDNTLAFAELHYYEKGEKIFQAGNILNYYYFFVEGKVKVFSMLENGKSLLLKFYTSFDALGDAELLRDIPILNNVETVENTYLIAIPARILRNACNTNVSFLKFMINSLSLKLESNNINNSYNLLYPLSNRFASYIIEHITNESNYIIFNSSYKDISEFLGTTYRHLSRTIQDLELNQIIKKEGKKIILLNKDELRNMAKNIYK